MCSSKNNTRFCVPPQGMVIKKNLDTILENIYSQKYTHTLPTENHYGPWGTSQPHKKPQARSSFSFFFCQNPARSSDVLMLMCHDVL